MARILANVTITVVLLSLSFIFSYVSILNAIVGILIELFVPTRYARLLGYYLWVVLLGQVTPWHKMEDRIAKRSRIFQVKEEGSKPSKPLFVPKDFLDFHRVWGEWGFAELVLRNDLEVNLTDNTRVLKINLMNQSYGIYNSKGKTFVQQGMAERTKEESEMLRASLNTEINELQHVMSEPLTTGGVREFQITKSVGYSIDLHKTPLRWASGGVLPVVWRNNRHWCLLFFRDYRPVGLNLANGGSEKEEEFTHPLLPLVREFNEEVVILDRRPVSANQDNTTFYQKRYHLDFLEPSIVPGKVLSRLESKKFGEEHSNLRSDMDGLEIEVELEDSSRLETKTLPTHFELHVTSGERKYPPVKDIVFSINPLEAGIECIKLLSFDLEPPLYPLHGEVSEWGFPLRRPFVLLALDYLAGLYAKFKSIGDVAPDRPEKGEIYLGGKMIHGPIPIDAFEIFGADIELAKKRKKYLEEKKKSKPLKVPEEKELEFLKGKSHSTMHYLRLIEQLIALKDVAKKTGVLSIDLTKNPDIAPFFVLNAVVWRTLELAFADGAFNHLSPPLRRAGTDSLALAT